MGVAGGLQLFREAWPDLKQRALAPATFRGGLRWKLFYNFIGAYGFSRSEFYTGRIRSSCPWSPFTCIATQSVTVTCYVLEPVKCTNVTVFPYNPLEKKRDFVPISDCGHSHFRSLSYLIASILNTQRLHTIFGFEFISIVLTNWFYWRRLSQTWGDEIELSETKSYTPMAPILSSS